MYGKGRALGFHAHHDSNQRLDAIPGYLDTDAEQDEGDDAENSVSGLRRDVPSDAGGVAVTEEDEEAEDENGGQDGTVREDVFRERFGRGVGAEGEHDDDAGGVDGDGKGEGVKDFLIDVAVSGWDDVGGSARRGVTLVEQGPSHGGEDEATGDLDDRERDSEESEESGAHEFDDEEEEDSVEGNLAGELAVDKGGGIAHEAEKDERGAERIHDRQQGAEGEDEELDQSGRRQHGAEQDNTGESVISKFESCDV
jgi:hypothetical protein